jgi:hypothetical protein
MRETPMEKIAKKKYEKPSIRMVSIAESVQVLGIGCKKVSSGTAFGITPCVIGTIGKCATVAVS